MAYSLNTGRMSSSVHNKLLQRETGSGPGPRSTSLRSLYGDRSWIANLDIVNELAGHQGCVNALSWSKSGSLLASGSDDTNLIIHKYQPEDTIEPFRLATCISTGHRANIFSVKFMPHSNDRTLISCAGDHEVRIFDLEYSGKSMGSSNASSVAGIRSQAGRRNLSHLSRGINYLSDGDANTKVYRSHSDRVKRIVTESSPHLFLTCSEDGEVRQFDLRLPSSAYPRQRSSPDAGFNDNTSPPLISYKKFQLDLNSISCSANQPHYIVLGGAHLHCFLHDRRMLGRDLTEERGSKVNSDMGTATRCVRRFAPNGKSIMKPRDPGHVTACKISDKNPNEMIASWSGDHIYGFNLIQADYMEFERIVDQQRSKESADRRQKLKRSAQSNEEEDVVIRMRYENGQTEDFPITREGSERFINQASNSTLTDSQRRSARIGKGVVKIRQLLLSLQHDVHLSELQPILSEVLGMCSAHLQEMHEIMSKWSYPMNPDAATVTIQTTLRKHRDASRHFVQACGVFAQTLAGNIPAVGTSSSSQLFSRIDISSIENSECPPEVGFRYSFLKAILLWLHGGTSQLAREYVQQSSSFADEEEAPELSRISYSLHTKACLLHTRAAAIDGERLLDAENSRIKTDEIMQTLTSELGAVITFTAAFRIPFREDESIASESTQSRGDAMIQWGLEVGRGLLMNAGEGIDFAFVDRAFGGPSVTSNTRSLEDIDDVLDDGDIDVGDEMVSEDAGEALSDDEEEEEEEEEDDDEEIDDDDGYDVEDEDIHDSSMDYGRSTARSVLRAQVNRELPYSSHILRYEGHCNVKTVKDVNFFGLDDEYVVSGSDSGHVFIWDAKTTGLLNILEGDGEVVNVVQGHPYEPTLAVAGIDNTIKIFSPNNRDQHAARKGLNLGISSNESSGSSSLRTGHRRAWDQSKPEPVPPDDFVEDISDDELAPGGLYSRQRMHDMYAIVSQNHVDRKGGNREAFITRDMLAQIAIMMAQRGEMSDGAGPNNQEAEDDDEAMEAQCASM